MCVVVLLHLVLIQSALSPAVKVSALEPPQAIVTADLHQMAPPELPQPAVVRKTTPKPKPAVTQPEADATDVTRTTTDQVENSSTLPPTTNADISPQKQALSLGAVTHFSVNPAPSAELKYKAHSQHKGQNIFGSGRIHWQTNGSTFAIKGEFNVLFLSLLNFSSEGRIDPETGIAPSIYSEKRLRKSETNTHFHRERNTISFSASTLAYDRPGGEQDRASIVWQLVGIGRRDGSKFAPGGVLDIAVAGVRNADVWQIRIVGNEEIETSLGKTRAWHLSRSARKDSYEQSLDVWLSPTHEWYPAKIRYTNTNGDFLDLALSEINRLPDQQ